MDKETKKLIEKLKKEFHTFWLESGEPHPASNAYLAMNRAFFFLKGMEHGIDISNEFNEEKEK